MNTIRVLHLAPGRPHQFISVNRDDEHALKILVDDDRLIAYGVNDDGIELMHGTNDSQPVNFSTPGNIIFHGPVFFFRRSTDGEIESVTDDDVARIMEWVARA